MDIGARGGIKWPWTKLYHNELSMVLVEPDPEEAEQLKKEMLNSKIEAQVLPITLWSSQELVKLNALVNCALLYGYVDYASAILSEDWLKKYLNQERMKNLLKLVKKESKVFLFSFKGSVRRSGFWI